MKFLLPDFEGKQRDFWDTFLVLILRRRLAGWLAGWLFRVSCLTVGTTDDFCISQKLCSPLLFIRILLLFYFFPPLSTFMWGYVREKKRNK